LEPLVSSLTEKPKRSLKKRINSTKSSAVVGSPPVITMPLTQSFLNDAQTSSSVSQDSPDCFFPISAALWQKPQLKPHPLMKKTAAKRFG
jgi:hypothetical protein